MDSTNSWSTLYWGSQFIDAEMSCLSGARKGKGKKKSKSKKPKQSKKPKGKKAGKKPNKKPGKKTQKKKNNKKKPSKPKPPAPVCPTVVEVMSSFDGKIYISLLFIIPTVTGLGI